MIILNNTEQCSKIKFRKEKHENLTRNIRYSKGTGKKLIYHELFKYQIKTNLFKHEKTLKLYLQFSSNHHSNIVKKNTDQLLYIFQL